MTPLTMASLSSLDPVRGRPRLRPGHGPGRDRALGGRCVPPRPPGAVPRPADERRQGARLGDLRGRGAAGRRAHARRPARPGLPLHPGREEPGRQPGGPGDRLDRGVPARARTTRRRWSRGWPTRPSRSSRSPSPRAATTSTPSPGSSTPTTRASCTTSQPGAAPKTTFGLVVEALDPASAARHPAVHGAVLRQHPGQRATPPAAASPRSPGCGTRSWASGWSSTCGSPTAWSTASPRSPPTTTAPRSRERFGVEDGWPVVCEPFTQWVLEDKFGLGRPPLEDAGVQVVDDVEPYELMKLRLLNASHQALCYFGYLAGYRLVHDVCQDPLFAEFLLAYMDREATPTLHARAGDRPARLQARADRAVLQPAGARHRRPAVRGELRPDPQVAAAGDPAQPRSTDGEIDRVGAGRGRLGALRRGRRRAGRADQDRRPAGRHAERRPRRRSATTRSRSSATGSCSATWSTTSGSPPTYQRFLASLHERGRAGDAGGPGRAVASSHEAGPALRGDPAGGRCR